MSNQLLWPEMIVTAALPAKAARKNSRAISTDNTALRQIDELNQQLLSRYQSRLVVQPSLTRSLVSFQANKDKAGYRWFKFKEAFSAPLIEYLLHQYQINQDRVLDPFAGSGTSLFVASSQGLSAEGIEVLPIGQTLIAVRKQLESGLSGTDLNTLRRWAEEGIWKQIKAFITLPELRITQGAYSAQTKESIEQYLTAMQQENEVVQSLLRLALLCVLESVSYTRKDGQYLRWDYRSGRSQGAKVFDKGRISEFSTAVSEKIREIIDDLNATIRPSNLFQQQTRKGEIRLFAGSCLEVMPGLPAAKYDAVITSPPYCNRYDYTRTYALELALLGVEEKELIQLRQQMLSCTVENREKDLLRINPNWKAAITAADEQPLLQAILQYLDEQKTQGLLNNNGIPRMVRGYFYEMACVIAECARVMKSDAPLLMVNDNVRYAGASVSVDLILSTVAEQLGLVIEQILVLPNGKGNSSQQMGEHGREALRKCVYMWRKKKDEDFCPRRVERVFEQTA